MLLGTCMKQLVALSEGDASPVSAFLPQSWEKLQGSPLQMQILPGVSGRIPVGQEVAFQVETSETKGQQEGRSMTLFPAALK